MTEPWRVLVVEAFDRAGMEMLAARQDINLNVVPGVTDSGFDRLLRTAHAVTLRMAPFTADLIEQARSLRVVSRHGVGYDTVDLEALTRRGIPLAVTGESNPATVAEHALALMLALARKLPQYDAAQRRGEFSWRLRAETVELLDKTVLLVGCGRIGQEVARRCAAFGMRVLVHDPYISADEVSAAGWTPAEDLEAAFAITDFVSLHAPLGPETEALIDAQALAVMKPTAFLINTARGGLVDETALVAALSEGRLAGAGLDVYDPQPPKADNPLFALDNVIVTPHSAGMTREGAARIGVACAQNVLDALDGCLNPDNVVNPGVLGAIGSVPG